MKNIGYFSFTFAIRRKLTYFSHPEKIIQMLKRKLFYKIKQHLGEKEYTIITGARQTGKTTLLMQIQDELLSENEAVYYLTLEDPEILTSLNEHPENIFNYLTINKQFKTYLLIILKILCDLRY